MLAALVAVNDEPWELSVVGSLTVDLDYSARIRKAVLTLGLEKKVRLLGSLSDVELASILKGSDIMAMPFSYEGFGIVYLEGMGYGLPAMACRSGGAGEIVKHGENGYLFGPDDKSEFANLLLRLVKDRDELLRLSLAARRHFDTFPTWDRSMARIRDFLIEVSSHAPVVKKE